MIVMCLCYLRKMDWLYFNFFGDWGLSVISSILVQVSSKKDYLQNLKYELSDCYWQKDYGLWNNLKSKLYIVDII